MSHAKRARYAACDSTGVVTAARRGDGRCATREVRCRGKEETGLTVCGDLDTARSTKVNSYGSGISVEGMRDVPNTRKSFAISLRVI